MAQLISEIDVRLLEKMQSETSFPCVFLGITRAVYELCKEQNIMLDYCQLHQELHEDLKRLEIFEGNCYAKDIVRISNRKVKIPFCISVTVELSQDLKENMERKKIIELHYEGTKATNMDTLVVFSIPIKDESRYFVVSYDRECDYDVNIEYAKKCYEISRLDDNSFIRQKSTSS